MTDTDLLLRGLRWMMLSRALDLRLIALQRQGRVGVHAPLMGQEAAVAGTALALDPARDWLVPSYREMVALVMHGLPLRSLFAMYMGRSGDGIPADVRLLPLQGAVAAQLPHAVGLAWGLRLQGRDEVVLAYFGEGATSEGDFHEACNVAGVTRAPVVLVCQDNAWAISTPRSRQTAAASVADRAAGYGIEGCTVDGGDLSAVFEAASAAVERARRRGGATLLVCRARRLSFHNTTDAPTRYVEPAEAETARREDPIPRLQRALRRRQAWNAAIEHRWNEEIAAKLESAVSQAQDQPAVHPGSIFENVFADPRAVRQGLAP